MALKLSRERSTLQPVLFLFLSLPHSQSSPFFRWSPGIAHILQAKHRFSYYLQCNFKNTRIPAKKRTFSGHHFLKDLAFNCLHSRLHPTFLHIFHLSITSWLFGVSTSEDGGSFPMLLLFYSDLGALFGQHQGMVSRVLSPDSIKNK